MKLHPIDDKCLVVRDTVEDSIYREKIIIAKAQKEPPQMGTVAAVGEGRFTEAGALVPMRVKVGDRILFTKYGGIEVTIEEKEFLVICEDDVLGIFREA